MARKMTEWPSKRGPITKIMPSDGWHRGYSSLGGGKVVRFPRIWMVYGECRFNYIRKCLVNFDNPFSFRYFVRECRELIHTSSV